MNQPGTDIENINDIKQIVDTFYAKVQEDDLLKDIFNGVIADRWPEHLEKMYRFWQTVLLEKYTYNGRPFPPHAGLPVERKHFDRWLKLFYETVDELFMGDKANEAKWRASKMAEVFHSKIQYLKNGTGKPLL